MKYSLMAGITAMTALLSCGTAQKMPNRIGLIPLENYTSRQAPPADTSYMVYRTETAFDAAFQPGTASRRPDFSGQTTVALVLPATPSGTALRWDRAEVEGNTMHVYAQSCTLGTDAGCLASPNLLATTPRSGNVKRVAFWVNGISRRVVEL